MGWFINHSLAYRYFDVFISLVYVDVCTWELLPHWIQNVLSSRIIKHLLRSGIKEVMHHLFESFNPPIDHSYFVLF